MIVLGGHGVSGRHRSSTVDNSLRTPCRVGKRKTPKKRKDRQKLTTHRAVEWQHWDHGVIERPTVTKNVSVAPGNNVERERKSISA